MSVLFAIESSDVPTGLLWYLADGQGRAEPVGADRLNKTGAQDAVLVVSGRDVFTGEADILARSDKEMRTAALFQLEDDLAEPPSDLHVAIGAKSTGATNRRKVAVASLKQMESWIDRLAAADLPSGLQPRIVADTSLLDARGEPVLFDGGGQVLLYTGQTNCAVDADIASELIPALLQDDDIAELDYLHDGGQQFQAGVPGVTLRPLGHEAYPDFLAGLLAPGVGLNLRQGNFRGQSDLDLGFAQRWIGSLAIAAIVFTLWLSYLGLSAQRLNSETDRLYQTAVRAYQSLYPDEARVVDPHGQTMTKLSGLSGSDTNTGVSGLLSTFYKGLEQVEGVELVDISYNQQTGRLSTKLKFASYEARDQLKQVMEGLGLSIDLPGVTQADSFLIGQAVLEARS